MIWAIIGIYFIIGLLTNYALIPLFPKEEKSALAILFWPVFFGYLIYKAVKRGSSWIAGWVIYWIMSPRKR